MDTEAPPTASDLPPPAGVSSKSDMYYQLPRQQISNSNKFAPSILPNRDTTPLTAKSQASLFLQPHRVAVQPAKDQQAAVVVNSDLHGGQQKKAARFVLEMPTLSLTQRLIGNQSGAPVATRALMSTPTVARTSTSLQPTYTLSNPRRSTQIQMPTLHTPKPKLPSLAGTRHISIATPSHTPATATPKPSLQIKLPSQVELSRPLAKPVGQTVAQQAQTGNARALYKDTVQPIPPPPPTTTQDSTNTVSFRAVSPPKAVEAEANSTYATSPQASQEMQVHVVENSHRSKGYSSQGIEGCGLDPNRVAEADVPNLPNAPNVNIPDMQIQEPRPLTTPIQQAPGTSGANDINVNTSVPAGNVEMAEPIYSESSFNNFNAPPHDQEMEANNNQNPEGAYPMYGGEMYQQPNEGMQVVCRVIYFSMYIPQ